MAACLAGFTRDDLPGLKEDDLFASRDELIRRSNAGYARADYTNICRYVVFR